MDNIREKLVELLRKTQAQVHGYCGISSVADYLIANNVTVQEWISVSEHPKESGEYIVTIKGEANATTLLYDDNVWFKEDDEGWRIFPPVTHWMPLPSAPKGE